MPKVLSLLSDDLSDADPLALAARRISLLGQDPEGYAKGCTALASFTDKLDIGSIGAALHIITSSTSLWKAYADARPDAVSVDHVEDVENWHGFEKLEHVAQLVGGFLRHEVGGLE